MKKLIIAIGLLASFSLHAQQIDRSKMPKPAKATQINIADPVIFKLANGLTVIVSENHKVPKVTFSLSVSDKSNLELGKAGLADLAGALVLTGTSNLSKDELDTKKDFIGASLSASDKSLTLSCLTKFREDGLKLMTDVLYNANFPESEFVRIKKQMESSLMTVKSSPEDMGENALMKALFANHPYGEVMTEESLNRINREDVINYYKTTFVPEGSYLVIVGDITANDAQDLAKKNFGSWNGNAKAISTYAEPQMLKGGNRVIFVKKTGAVQSYIQIAQPMNIAIGSPDALPLNVMNGVLGGGGFGTRLFQNLREDKGYTYGAYSSVDVAPQGAYFSASGSFRTEVTDSAIVELLKEINGMASGKVTDDELSLTKASMSGSFGRSLEHASTIARFATTIERYGLDKNHYKNYLQNLQAITQSSVQDVAQKYLAPNSYYIVVVGDDSVLDRIKQFDGDGRVEIVDEFGNPAQEMMQADITADQLIEKYSLAMTNAKNAAERDKKLKKVKSVLTQSDITISQAPITLQAKQFWAAPNISASVMEMNGMILEKTVFNGKTGTKMDAQTGSHEMTTEEIKDAKKDVGYIPEINYAKTGRKYELLGIENQNGNLLYVVKLSEANEITLEYFNKTTFLKTKTVKIGKSEEGEAYESTITYSDYKTVGAIQIPHKTTMGMGEMVFTSTVKSAQINKGSLADFK